MKKFTSPHVPITDVPVVSPGWWVVVLDDSVEAAVSAVVPYRNKIKQQWFDNDLACVCACGEVEEGSLYLVKTCYKLVLCGYFCQYTFTLC